MKNFIIILLTVFVCSCRTSQWTETNLYFGQSKPGGAMITENEWTSFRENYISKVFREGSSVVSLSGNWYDTAARRLITEPAYMVSYYYRYSPGISGQIDSLRNWYKELFKQQSVLRIDRKVKASF